MKPNFSYATHEYFSGNVKFLGIVLLIMGLLLFTNASFVASAILLLLAITIFTTSYGIDINFSNKEVFDYLKILGFKKGDKSKFETIECLFMTSGLKKTKMQLRASNTDHVSTEYHGYLKISDEKKIHLLSSVTKIKVEELLNRMSRDLNVDFADLSNNK